MLFREKSPIFDTWFYSDKTPRPRWLTEMLEDGSVRMGNNYDRLYFGCGTAMKDVHYVLYNPDRGIRICTENQLIKEYERISV